MNCGTRPPAGSPLAALLLLVYGGVFDRTKAPFTLALMLFAVAFLAQNALVVHSYVTMTPLVPEAMDPYLLSIGGVRGRGTRRDGVDRDALSPAGSVRTTRIQV